MLNTINVMSKLDVLDSRHNKLKAIFAKAQLHIETIQANNLVTGIEVQTATDKKTVVTYIDRRYEIDFSTFYEGDELKGKVSFYRRLDEDNIAEQPCAEYDMAADIADSIHPDQRGKLKLNNHGDSIILVLNWIWDDINV